MFQQTPTKVDESVSTDEQQINDAAMLTAYLIRMDACVQQTTKDLQPSDNN
jgi:hypothetical protein